MIGLIHQIYLIRNIGLSSPSFVYFQVLQLGFRSQLLLGLVSFLLADQIGLLELQERRG